MNGPMELVAGGELRKERKGKRERDASWLAGLISRSAAVSESRFLSHRQLSFFPLSISHPNHNHELKRIRTYISIPFLRPILFSLSSSLSSSSPTQPLPPPQHPRLNHHLALAYSLPAPATAACRAAIMASSSSSPPSIPASVGREDC